jgi:probable phosphomutase (TIGR03848 family)
MQSATTVIWVRHGQTPTTGKILPGRTPGLHLSKTGAAQAQSAADRIALLGDRVAALYTSQLERARETAAPIAKALGKRAVVDKGLLECDFGKWTGRKLDQLRKLPEWNQVQNAPSQFRFPDGESLREMQARVLGSVARYRVEHDGKIVVAVSHADVIKSALVDALGMHLDLYQRIVVAPASASVVRYGPTGAMVLAVNVTDSFEGIV